MSSASQGNLHQGFCDSEADLIQDRLVQALTELYELLEEYAPSWYTRELHEKADSALRSIRR